MPLMKIPDSVLSELRCRCTQYLSKPPISVEDGVSLCKDCTEGQAPTPLAVTQNTAYEAVATFFAFPCRYKSQGCPKYIEFNKLEKHEVTCSYRLFDCPVNFHSSCNGKDTVRRLYQHYQNFHSELILETPIFNINMNEDHELYRIFKTDDVLLLLQTKCDVKRAKLWFNMVYFGQADNSSLISYDITLRGTSNKDMSCRDLNPVPINCIQMIPENCEKFDIPTVVGYLEQSEAITCEWTITVSDQLKKNIENQQKFEEAELHQMRNENIKCLHCGIYMVPPIYRCSCGHVTCADCKGYYDECKTCQKNDSSFILAVDLEELSKSENHYCRWINCRQALPYTEIREHEQNCIARRYICPVCNIWSGSEKGLILHFKSVHPEIKICESSSVSFELNKLFSAYVIAHREIFKLIMRDISNMSNPHQSKIKINVWYLGPPSLANSWQYKVTGGNPGCAVMEQFTSSFNCQSSSITVGNSNNPAIFGTLNSARFNNFGQLNSQNSNVGLFTLTISKLNGT